MKSIRKTAPSRVALIFTSRSMGKLMPKLSASVNASLSTPDHCLEIFPTWGSQLQIKHTSYTAVISALTFSPVCSDRTSNSTSLMQQLMVLQGPEILSTVSPASFLIANLG